MVKSACTGKRAGGGWGIEVSALPDGPQTQQVVFSASAESHESSAISLPALWQVIVRRRKLILSVECGLLLLCLLYCLISPKEYEARASVELRTSPASTLSLDPAAPAEATSAAASATALETLAGVLRSDQLAWKTIAALKLYQEPGFCDHFAQRFPGFRVDAPSPAAQTWLLERFAARLHVQTVPRTLLVQIRFRSRDAALSAAVVNELIHAYSEQDSESQVQATAMSSGWLEGQLKELKTRVDRDQSRLAEFEKKHGILGDSEVLANGQSAETEHNAIALEVDELGRELAAATADRILAESEYRAVRQGDPELVIASESRLQNANANLSTALLQQIRARRSDLEQEQAQLSAEHGPNFPRVIEIGRQLDDLERQRQTEDAKLLERLRSNWQALQDREQLVRQSLDEATEEGLKRNEAETEYAIMRQEANASHDLYMRVLAKVQEAGLSAGIHSSNLEVVDPAREPVKPVAPNLPMYLAITFFAGLWLAAGSALMLETFRRSDVPVAAMLLAIFAACVHVHAQAPTPSTSGLPTGVANFPQTPEARSQPNPKESPGIWNQPNGPATNSGHPLAEGQVAMPAAIGPGDWVEVSEYHTPEFHSAQRVSSTGTMTLPMIGEVKLSGMDEQGAAHAIEAELRSKGILLHPLVSVVVTFSAGQDVTVLGEVMRPGIYPYGFHHRLLDLISAASGLAPDAGRLVNVIHRDDPKKPHPVVLDAVGTEAAASDHNPELNPGDTVQVSRAGLVYVVGDVIRPGGFPVDPAQKLTVVQAVSLAWGPTQNAAPGKAVLIREQESGRTLTALNLKRLLRGQDPDQPVRDGDIIFVPNSFAKNLMNRTLESAVQSTVGVTIYSALVYSQRY
ncbi:MAG TPA: polysaccharide biosynthesis/export family protein [Terracidiphilus sp.]|nr:polysaccharide biosynthesis/export family protein [Terracidiphilus sp.]